MLGMLYASVAHNVSVFGVLIRVRLVDGECIAASLQAGSSLQAGVDCHCKQEWRWSSSLSAPIIEALASPPSWYVALLNHVDYRCVVLYMNHFGYHCVNM